MIGIPVGLAVANASEWLIHKYVLHGLGAKKKSFWSFHWHEHHRNARRNEHIDETYDRSLLGWHAQSKEALGLAGMAVAVAPMFPVAPFLTGTFWYSMIKYYRVHKRAHQDTEWAREHLPWHYDHHMGPNQHANWCVTRPWMDVLMGTREPYAGTAREAEDNVKRARLKARREARRRAAEESTDAPTGASSEGSDTAAPAAG